MYHARVKKIAIPCGACVHCLHISHSYSTYFTLLDQSINVECLEVKIIHFITPASPINHSGKYWLAVGIQGGRVEHQCRCPTKLRQLVVSAQYFEHHYSTPHSCSLLINKPINCSGSIAHCLASLLSFFLLLLPFSATCSNTESRSQSHHDE